MPPSFSTLLSPLVNPSGICHAMRFSPAVAEDGSRHVEAGDGLDHVVEHTRRGEKSGREGASVKAD